MEREGFELHVFIPGNQRKSSQKHGHKKTGGNKDLDSATILTLGTWERVSVWMETKLFKKNKLFICLFSEKNSLHNSRLLFLSKGKFPLEMKAAT